MGSFQQKAPPSGNAAGQVALNPARHVQLEHSGYFGTGEGNSVSEDVKKEFLKDLHRTFKETSRSPHASKQAGLPEVWTTKNTGDVFYISYQANQPAVDPKLFVLYESNPVTSLLKKHLGFRLDKTVNATITFNFSRKHDEQGQPVGAGKKNASQHLTTTDWDNIKRLDSNDIPRGRVLPMLLKICATRGATQDIVANGVLFSKGVCKDFNFSNLNLRGSTFRNCVFKGMDFSGCDLTDARFENCVFLNCTGVGMTGVESATVVNCKTQDKKVNGVSAIFELSDKKLYSYALNPEKRRFFRNLELRGKDLSEPSYLADFVLKNEKNWFKISLKLAGCIFDETTTFHKDPAINQRVHQILVSYSKEVTVPERGSISQRTDARAILDEITMSALFRTGEVRINQQLQEIQRGNYKLLMKPNDNSVYMLKPCSRDKKRLVDLVEVAHGGTIKRQTTVTIEELLSELGLKAHEKNKAEAEKAAAEGGGAAAAEQAAAEGASTPVATSEQPGRLRIPAKQAA